MKLGNGRDGMLILRTCSNCCNSTYYMYMYIYTCSIYTVLKRKMNTCTHMYMFLDEGQKPETAVHTFFLLALPSEFRFFHVHVHVQYVKSINTKC